MRNKKTAITLALASTLALGSFSSCGTKELEFKEYENYDEFRFYAYMTPPPANVGSGILMDNPDYMTDQQYDWVKECGFNYGVAIYENTYVLANLFQIPDNVFCYPIDILHGGQTGDLIFIVTAVAYTF